MKDPKMLRVDGDQWDMADAVAALSRIRAFTEASSNPVDGNATSAEKLARLAMRHSKRPAVIRTNPHGTTALGCFAVEHDQSGTIACVLMGHPTIGDMILNLPMDSRWIGRSTELLSSNEIPNIIATLSTALTRLVGRIRSQGTNDAFDHLRNARRTLGRIAAMIDQERRERRPGGGAGSFVPIELAFPTPWTPASLKHCVPLYTDKEHALDERGRRILQDMFPQSVAVSWNPDATDMDGEPFRLMTVSPSGIRMGSTKAVDPMEMLRIHAEMPFDSESIVLPDEMPR